MKVGDIVHPDRAGNGKPLEGIRILALEQQQALPYCTQLLARLGAEVVRVEPPGRGDTGRDTFPAMKDPQGRSTGATFLRNNLNKRSIAIDLKKPAGRELVLRMAPKFDVFAENFRTGTLARMKLAYEDVARVHPKVVYCSISGFGADGKSPYSRWSAFAPVVEAMSAFYDQKRLPHETPVIGVAGALGDTSTGLFASVGILAALRQRDAKGFGQHVDLSMYDAMIAMGDLMFNFWSLGKSTAGPPPSISTSFKAKDGWFVMMCSRKAQLKILADTIGHPEWIDDPRFANAGEWGLYIESVFRPAIEGWAAARTKREVCEILNGAGVAVGPCHSVEEVMGDPHVRDHHMIVEMPRVDGVTQPVITPGNPVKLSRVAEGPETRVPWLGEHTDEVLERELGLGASEIAELRSDRVIG